jgi:hypothetical protein
LFESFRVLSYCVFERSFFGGHVYGIAEDTAGEAAIITVTDLGA